MKTYEWSDGTLRREKEPEWHIREHGGKMESEKYANSKEHQANRDLAYAMEQAGYFHKDLNDIESHHVVYHYNRSVPDWKRDVPPMEFPDGSLVGVRIGYMNRDGVFCSPRMGTKWFGDNLDGAEIWAVDPQSPNVGRLLEKYARDLEKRDFEPVLATVAVSGDVNILSSGEFTATHMDIVGMEKYRK